MSKEMSTLNLTKRFYVDYHFISAGQLVCWNIINSADIWDPIFCHFIKIKMLHKIAQTVQYQHIALLYLSDCLKSHIVLCFWDYSQTHCADRCGGNENGTKSLIKIVVKITVLLFILCETIVFRQQIKININYNWLNLYILNLIY